MNRGGSKITLGLLLPLGLAIGFMLAGIGTAIWPPMSSWAGAIICSGTLDVQSDYYTTPSGGSGVNRHLLCRSGDGKDQQADEITFEAIGVAGLVYAAIVFVLLLVFAAPRMRRAAEARQAKVDFGGGISARGVGSEAELQAILGQVSEALRHGEADVTVRNVTVGGAEGGDTAGRLAVLKQLHEAGLIGDEDYEAKKAEILSRL